MKPFKGNLRKWCICHAAWHLRSTDTLGYYIMGTPEGHPDFPKSRLIATSMVIKHTKHIENGKILYEEIETLNSRYKLV